MKWLKVYGLPKLPLFLARWAMRLGLPGPTWYKWKAASAGTGVILDEMIRAADDLGYDGQKVGKLAMSRIGEKQGSDLREQLGVKTMKDAVVAHPAEPRATVGVYDVLAVFGLGQRDLDVEEAVGEHDDVDCVLHRLDAELFAQVGALLLADPAHG